MSIKMEPLDSIKTEPELPEEETWIFGVCPESSAQIKSETQSLLYADHEVKEEMVIGPTVIQRPLTGVRLQSSETLPERVEFALKRLKTDRVKPRVTELSSNRRFKTRESLSGNPPDIKNHTASNNEQVDTETCALSINEKNTVSNKMKIRFSKGKRQESQDLPTSSSDVTSTTNQEETIKRKRTRDNCYFCKIDVLNFARHIIRKHTMEAEVQTILSYPKKSNTRTNLITDLRKKGNYLNNAGKCVKPMKKSNIHPYIEYGACGKCLGFYAKKQLWKHKQNCQKLSEINLNSRTDDLRVETQCAEKRCTDKGCAEKRCTEKRCTEKARTKRQCEVKQCAEKRRAEKLSTEKACTKKRCTEKRCTEKRCTEKRCAEKRCAEKLSTEKACTKMCAKKPCTEKRCTEKRCAEKRRAEKRCNDNSKKLNKISILDLASDLKLFNNYLRESSKSAALKLTASKLEENDTEQIEEKSERKVVENNSVDTPKSAQRCEVINKEFGTMKKRILVPWTQQQKNIVTQFFSKHIKSKKPPRRHECDELRGLHPDVFGNKDWLKIKVFVQNVYTKEK